MAVAPAWASSGEKEFDLDELETSLEELERDLLEMNESNDKLLRSHAELMELQLVLDTAGPFFDYAQSRLQGLSQPGGLRDDGTIEAPLISSAQEASRLGFVAGLISQAKMAPFERVVFRATRGNMFLKQQACGKVMDPGLREEVEKCVFVVFFSGERARAKILKICDAFNANRYPFPEELDRQRQMNSEVMTRLKELKMTIDAGTSQRDTLLHRVSSNLRGWMTMVRHEKAIYHTLNMFSVDVTKKALVGEGWIPKSDRDSIKLALREATAQSNTQVQTVFQQLKTTSMPPTHFKTNKWTSAFQGIINAYGVPRYREVNPTVFTVVTFPYLFALMFGDVGHGLLLLMGALVFVVFEKKLGKGELNEIIAMAFGGRYVLLLMGIFAIYTGFIYNEFFSMPLNWFGGTSWACNFEACAEQLNAQHAAQNFTTTAERVEEAWVEYGKCACDLSMWRERPYLLGIDPIWHGTKTDLTMLNSVKMKMAIIIGVVQMSLGIICSLFNHLRKPVGPERHTVDKLSIYYEFIPQMLFLQLMFGYLSLLMIIKWMSGSVADLFTIMINMFLSPGSNECGDGCPDTDPLYGLGLLNLFLLLVCFACVPWMLLPKPLILKKQHEQKSQGGGTYEILEEVQSEGVTVEAAENGDHEEFEFGEVMVHQIIHTIEFVLGAISNTASYLRLWALSLAHSQLSDVFYNLVFMAAIQMKSPTAIVIGFFVWALATFGVLMVMETLSAFLHALRLHWVEYMNKFYYGDGKEFKPFAFSALTIDLDAS